MSYLEQLLPASFRRADFGCPSNGLQGGRIIVEHIYPDSNRHYMEDNGKQPVRYSLDGILHGPNFIDKFLALKSALEAPGPGTLLHPWLGAVYVVVNGFDVNETQRDGGVIQVRMDFVETDAPLFPSVVTGSSSIISPLTSSALRSMADAFKAAYPSPSSSFTALSISDGLNGIVDTFDEVFRSVSGFNELAADLKSPVAAYNGNNLTSNLFGLYAAPVRDDNITATQLFSGWKKVARAATSIDEIKAEFDVTTVDLRTRAQAIKALKAAHYGAVLVGFCEAVAYRDYVASNEASRDQKFIIKTQRDVFRHIDPEARQNVLNVVNATLEYLRSVEIQLPKIETMLLNDWPVGPLAYQLYDDPSMVDVLIGINQDDNLMLFENSAEVLKGGG